MITHNTTSKIFYSNRCSDRLSAFKSWENKTCAVTRSDCELFHFKDFNILSLLSPQRYLHILTLTNISLLNLEYFVVSDIFYKMLSAPASVSSAFIEIWQMVATLKPSLNVKMSPHMVVAIGFHGEMFQASLIIIILWIECEIGCCIRLSNILIGLNNLNSKSKMNLILFWSVFISYKILTVTFDTVSQTWYCSSNLVENHLEVDRESQCTK